MTTQHLDAYFVASFNRIAAVFGDPRQAANHLHRGPSWSHTFGDQLITMAPHISSPHRYPAAGRKNTPYIWLLVAAPEAALLVGRLIGVRIWSHLTQMEPAWDVAESYAWQYLLPWSRYTDLLTVDEPLDPRIQAYLDSVYLPTPPQHPSPTTPARRSSSPSTPLLSPGRSGIIRMMENAKVTPIQTLELRSIPIPPSRSLGRIEKLLGRTITHERRHHLAGEPVHCGDMLEIYWDDCWTLGRYEWTGEPETAPILYVGNDRAITLTDEHLLRWPKP